MSGGPLSTLRARLVALPLIIVVPPLATVLYTAVRWRQHEVTDSGVYALQIVRHASNTYGREIEGARQLLLAAAPIAADLPHSAPAFDAFVKAARYGGTPVEIGYADWGGATNTSIGPMPALSEPVRRTLFDRAARAPTFVAEYDVQSVSAPAKLALAYRVASNSGQPRGIVFAISDMPWFGDRGVTGILPNGTIATVFDDEGKVLAQFPPTMPWVGRSARGQPVVDLALRSGGDGITEATAFDGLPRVFAFGPLQQSPGRRQLYVSIGNAKVFAVAAADVVLSRAAAVLAGSLILALVGVAWTTNVLIVRPLHAVVSAAERLSDGDMHARVGALNTPAELRRLGDSFDRMAEALQSREATLVRQERRFRALIENSAEVISLRDASGTWLYLSPSNARVLGYAPEELIGRQCLEFVHPEDRARAEAALVEVGRAAGRLVSTTFRARRKDGVYRWIESQDRNVSDDPSVGAIVSNYRDITAWHEAQDELRRARDDLELRVRERTAEVHKLWRAVEQTADSVFVTDRLGVIEYVNPAFERMTGYTRAEAVGATPRLFASGLHSARFFSDMWHLILSGQVFRAIVTNRTKDGKLFDEDQTITPVADADGAITHFVATGRDVTQRNRMQEALRRLNTMLEGETTRIAAVLHDEAGQFLTAAHITLADIVREAPATRPRVEDVRAQLDHVEEQLRSLSHDLHPRILQDLGLLGALRFRAEAFARRKGLLVDVCAPAQCSCSPAAQVAIYRLVQEALTNVGRHARAQHVTITVACRPGEVLCSIRDDGVGFDVAAAFERGSESSFGLRAMRDRVEALGGSLEIVSSKDAGTEVRASLPWEC